MALKRILAGTAAVLLLTGVVAESADAQYRSSSSSKSYGSSSKSKSWGTKSSRNTTKSTTRGSKTTLSGSWTSKSKAPKTSKSLWDRKGKSKVATASGRGSASSSSGHTTSAKAVVVLPQNPYMGTAPAQKGKREETSRFKVSSTPMKVSDIKIYKSSPLFGKTVRGYKADTHYKKRKKLFGDLDWDAPDYAYRSRPAFGMWDALALWLILDMADQDEYAAWAYHHQDDPGYQEWHAEAEQLAETNPEIATQLATLDRQVASMSGERDASYLPPGMDADVAIAPDAAATLASTDDITAEPTPVLRVGTGGLNGNYYPFCNGESGAMKGLKGHAGTAIDISCIATNGTVENAEGLIQGTFDAALMQSDEVARLGGISRMGGAFGSTLYPEYVQLLVNEDSGIGSVKDLDPDETVIYLMGSGAKATWDGLVAQDDAYGVFDANLREVGADVDALKLIADNPRAVGVYVSGLNSELLRTANDRFGDELELAVVDDWDFNDARDADGNQIYYFAGIPGGTYPDLQSGWFSSSVETLSVGAMFVVSQDWVRRFGTDGTGALEKALWAAIPEIEARVGQD